MTHSVAMAVAGLIGSPNESLTKLGKNGQVRGGIAFSIKWFCVLNHSFVNKPLIKNVANIL